MRSETRMVRLDGIARVNPARRVRKGEQVPFIDMAALPQNSRDISRDDIVRREAKGAGSHFQNGDTLLARITPCLENGKTAQVRCLDAGEIGEGSTEFIVLSGIDPADDDFIYYLCRDPSFRAYAISRMEGTSGRQRVTWQSISVYEFDCPPDDARREAARILAVLDDRIDLLRQTNATLESIAQALFKSWFIDFDPVRAKAEGREPEGMDAATAALFPAEFEESALGLIPNGWRVQSLDALATYLNGLALQKFPPESETEFLPVVKIAQLRAGHTVGADRASTKLKPEYIVRDGDVLFSWSGSLEVELWCGGDGALNQHLFKVTSDRLPTWFCYLATRNFLPTFREIAAHKATTMGHIQRKHLAESRLALPADPIIHSLGDAIGPLIERRVANSLQARTLASLRDTLLPRLISGKLRLPEARAQVEEAVA